MPEQQQQHQQRASGADESEHGGAWRVGIELGLPTGAAERALAEWAARLRTALREHPHAESPGDGPACSHSGRSLRVPLVVAASSAEDAEDAAVEVLVEAMRQAEWVLPGGPSGLKLEPLLVPALRRGLFAASAARDEPASADGVDE